MSINKNQVSIPLEIISMLKECCLRIISFLKANWIGISLILITTLVFFWPTISRISTYSPGGDSMFNAWTLARDQHCILRDGCPNYINGNIFYPNKYSMVYSETQLSAGLLTLPFYLINQNPIFSNNVWTIISIFFAGFFMYLLIKYISKGNEFYSALAGLAFAFGPPIIGEYTHLQNLSIFYLPLIVLFIMKYLDFFKRKYLVGLFITLLLFFYASWYQMVFGLMAMSILLPMICLLKMKRLKQIVPIILTILFAIIFTLPLAKSYIQFAKQSGAKYGISDQIKFSASAADYIIPYKGTILGDAYYKIRPHDVKVNSYSPDGESYMGITLYVVAAFMLVITFINRKINSKWNLIFKFVLIFSSLAVVGFFISLGPFLKLGSQYQYQSLHSPGIAYTVALPYLIVDLTLSQLSFIRAIDRANVLVLFSLCCILGYIPLTLTNLKLKKITYYSFSLAILLGLFIEFFPLHRIPMSDNPYYYNMNIPSVYKLIKNNPNINNLVVLSPDNNYPNTKFLPAPFLNGVFEQVLWAGYDNKNTFNGYSGYFPPNYNETINQFNNFQSSDIPLMKKIGLHYILVDKLLSSSKPDLVDNISSSGLHIIYKDSRYVLFKIN